MRISTMTLTHARRFGFDAAISRIAAAGFDCFDLTLTFDAFNKMEMEPIYSSDWKEYADHLLTICRENHICCNQSHAPFPSAPIPTEAPDPSASLKHKDVVFDLQVRSIQFAARMGASCIIVHPVKAYPHLGREDYWKDVNMELYRALAPTAKESGIKIALENMFVKGPDGLVESCCGNPYSFVDWLDTLADDCFTACLDIGHCAICRYDPAEAIRILGKDRLTALHIHDNNLITDNHFLPGTGGTGVNWDSVLAALSEIGYTGDFTLETDHSTLKPFPDDQFPAALKTMAETARRMADRIS